MRIDFHFYTIYALARAVGFSPDKAYVIAYSSQYTDDEVEERKILFENGGEFEPFITGHRILDPHTVSAEICKRVWIPFHFLPGNLGDGDEKLITRANGPIAGEMISQFLSYDLLPYSCHLLGIMLHVYADTWSHQNFMGITDDMNRVNDLVVEGENIYLYKLAPPLGHAQAGSTPDEPRLAWEYSGYQGGAQDIDNYRRALQAAQNCYLLLSKFMDKFAHDFRDSSLIKWAEIEGKVLKLFQYNKDLRGCINSWGEAINNGEFGFMPHEKDINLIYDAGEWFNIAIKTESRMNPESGHFEIYYYKNDNFETSDCNYFNRAAAFYWSTLFAENENVNKLGLYTS